MHANSLLTSTLLLALSLITPAHADGQASISLYKDDNCNDASIIEEFRPAFSGSGGCSTPWQVPSFKGARLNWSQGLTAVAICPQGYSCESGSANLVGTAGTCVKSYGSFDKVQICIS
ncbi:hypothetical protein BJX64DRAFT_267128 [Aspergillus heterothallicus]